MITPTRNSRDTCSATLPLVSATVFRLAVALLVLTGAIAQADEEGKTLAIYGDASVAKTLPPGWSFSWNESGKIGDGSAYSPLAYDETLPGYRALGVSEAMQKVAPFHTISKDYRKANIVVKGNKTGAAHFYIASFTIPEDPTGDIWINNGNILNKSFTDGVILQIYVNNELKFESLFKKNSMAGVFQQNLGQLKKGDAVRVAIGAPEKSKSSGGVLFYEIQEFPSGTKPAPPRNVLSPAIAVLTPQVAANGKIDPSYAEKHKLQCEQLSTLKPELVLLGDSITARWPMPLLAEKFGKYHPVNLGIGGDWIQNVLWRIQNGPLDQVHPKVIVLLIGTNNITAGFSDEEVVGGVSAILTAIHKKTPESKILLEAILPRGPSLSEPINEKIRQVNAKLATLASGKDVFFLDVSDKLVEPDGTISAEVMPDKLHVAAPGYTRWLEALAPVLENLLNDKK